MPVQSSADATWKGGLTDGSGSVTTASGVVHDAGLTWRARAETRESGTSPEELIAAAHAGCFSMALAAGLAKDGHPAELLTTNAKVTFQGGEGITGIHLSVRGTVPGIDASTFGTAAENAKANCPVSKALAGVPISLDASLQ